MHPMLIAALAAFAPILAVASDAPATYAVWQVSAKERCEFQGPDLGHRNTIAVLVARDYLVAPMAAFDASFDFSKDPDVCIHDPKSPAPIRAQLVDVDTTYEMVLIRAAKPPRGVPVILDRATRPTTDFVRFIPTIAQPAPGTVELTPNHVRLSPCRHTQETGFFGSNGIVPGLCAMGMVESFNGIAAFSSPMTLSALFTDHARSLLNGEIVPMLYLGVPSTRIRAFVEGYFTSWGKYVKDKPRLP